MEINSDTKISVLGYGSWATALVCVLTSNGHSVTWHIRNSDILESITNEGRNCKYLPDIHLDTSLITASDDINAVVKAGEFIVMAMPSAYIADYLAPLKVSLRNKFILSAVKGIVPGENCSVTEYLRGCHGVSFDNIGVICGPSHAEEVSLGRLPYLSVACLDNGKVQAISDLFSSPVLKVHRSPDIFGIEYAAILKNIYAIAAGMATGLGYGDNFLSILVASCCDEMPRYLTAAHAADHAEQRRNYLADLLVTCYSPYSRNRRLGQLIGKGCSVKSALNEMTMVAEGYFAAAGMHGAGHQAGLEMPIMEMVWSVLYGGARARTAMKHLSEKL